MRRIIVLGFCFFLGLFLVTNLGAARKKSATTRLAKADEASPVSAGRATKKSASLERKKLINILKSEEDDQARIQAIYSLGELGDKSVADDLFDLLIDENIQIRLESAIALAKLGDKASLKVLVNEGLTDKNFTMRDRVIDALDKLGNKKAVGGLGDTLMRDTDENIRAKSALLLGKFGGKFAIKILIKGFRDTSRVVTDSISLALEEMKDREAVVSAVTIGVIRHKIPSSRAGCAFMLGRLGIKPAIPELLRALNDGDPMVRIETAYALARVEVSSGTNAFIRFMNTSDDAGKRTMEILDFLEKDSKNEYENVRLEAVSVLTNLAGKYAVNPLIRTLSDRSVAVRKKAVLGLEKIGDESAVPALIESLKKDRNPGVRAQIASTLGNMGDKRAIYALKKAKKDTDKNVRKKAAESLIKLVE